MTERLVQIDGNEDAQGTTLGSGAGITVGPIDLYPPLRKSQGGCDPRGQSVYVRNEGTAYTTITLQGRLDPADDAGWVTVWDLNTGAAASIAGGASKFVVLGAAYSQIQAVTTGGSGDSTLTVSVGP
jgi:hypothetical protein